jgi:recombination protein RecT
VAKLKGSDEPIFTVLTKREVDKYRARSKTGKWGPWRDDYDAMALKTAVRRLFRWLPKSTEMARAAAVEQAPESGQAQSTEWDPTITEALTSGGVEVPEDAPEPVTEIVDDREIT